MVKRKAAVSPKRSIPLRDSKGYPCQSSSSIVLVVVLGLVPATPRNANLPSPIVLVIVLVLAIDSFPMKGRKSHLRCFRSRLFLKATRYSPGNGQSSITSTSTIGDRHPPALPPPNQMFSGCPKLPWSTLGCDVPWHNKVRRHSRTRQEQRRSKSPPNRRRSRVSFPQRPENAHLPDPISPHRARSRARDRFLPDEGEKRPPSCFRSRLSLKATAIHQQRSKLDNEHEHDNDWGSITLLLSRPQTKCFPVALNSRGVR
jgi:hypothetical protein